MRLSIEAVGPDHMAVRIFGDREGLQELLGCLQILVNGADEDCHLMTPSWGGDELTEDEPDEGNQLVHELDIYLV